MPATALARFLPVTALARAALAATLALPASAETPMTGEEFDAYTVGRTLSYASGGQPYGIEQYLPGRRVRWAFIGDTCQEGTWYESGPMICFVYDYNPDDHQCWIFTRTPDGMTGVFQGPDGPGTELYEVQQSDLPLTCQNLDVGV